MFVKGWVLRFTEIFYNTLLFSCCHFLRGVSVSASHGYKLTASSSTLTAVFLVFAKNLHGLWRCIKHQCVCLCVRGGLFGLPDSVLHVYLLLPVSYHTCTSTATCVLPCNICIIVWWKRIKYLSNFCVFWQSKVASVFTHDEMATRIR